MAEEKIELELELRNCIPGKKTTFRKKHGGQEVILIVPGTFTDEEKDVIAWDFERYLRGEAIMVLAPGAIVLHYDQTLLAGKTDEINRLSL